MEEEARRIQSRRDIKKGGHYMREEKKKVHPGKDQKKKRMLLEWPETGGREKMRKGLERGRGGADGEKGSGDRKKTVKEVGWIHGRRWGNREGGKERSV